MKRNIVIRLFSILFVGTIIGSTLVVPVSACSNPEHSPYCVERSDYITDEEWDLYCNHNELIPSDSDFWNRLESYDKACDDAYAARWGSVESQDLLEGYVGTDEANAISEEGGSNAVEETINECVDGTYNDLIIDESDEVEPVVEESNNVDSTVKIKPNVQDESNPKIDNNNKGTIVDSLYNMIFYFVTKVKGIIIW